MDLNIINLRSVYGKVEQSYLIQPCVDPETGRMPECVRQVNKDGDMILSPDDIASKKVCIPIDATIEVKDGTTFNLTKERQRAEWEAIRHSDLIAESRSLKDMHGVNVFDGTNDQFDESGNYRGRYGVAVLYVDHPGEVSSKFVDSKKLRHKAEDFVINDSKQGLLTKCKLLGRDMTYAEFSDVESYLLSLANSDPNRIIELYTGSDTEIQMLLIDAEDKNVIIRRGGLYMYGDNINLGATRESVLFFLKQPANKRVVELIKKETYPEYYTSEEPEEGTKTKKK